MPNAIVATITMPSSRRNRCWFARARRRVHAGVIRQRRDALLVEPLGRVLDLAARQAIDDARFARVRREEILELAPRLVLLDDAVADVRPVEARDELLRRSSASRSTISRRVGASAVAVSAMRGTFGKRSCSTVELAVFGPEIVAPLRDAVRLVDREQRDLAAREHVEAALGQQPLGRDVQQFSAPFAKRCSTSRCANASRLELRNAASTPSWRSAST